MSERNDSDEMYVEGERNEVDEGYVEEERVVEEERGEYEDVDPNPAERGKWISAVIALAGAWLVGAALLFDALTANFWNAIIVGAGLLVVGGYNFYRRSNDEVGSTAAAVVAASLGLWLIAAPFLYGAGFAGGLFDGVAAFELGELTTELAFWNDVVVGLVALVLGAYSASETRENDVEVARTARR